jgi:hypothetical protein
MIGDRMFNHEGREEPEESTMISDRIFLAFSLYPSAFNCPHPKALTVCTSNSASSPEKNPTGKFSSTNMRISPHGLV